MWEKNILFMIKVILNICEIFRFFIGKYNHQNLCDCVIVSTTFLTKKIINESDNNRNNNDNDIHGNNNKIILHGAVIIQYNNIQLNKIQFNSEQFIKLRKLFKLYFVPIGRKTFLSTNRFVV